MKSSPPGQIITFYSYKGGTGRTMALANVACLLGQGYPTREQKRLPRVLVLDWDFEAPGLHRYFRPYLNSPADVQFESIPGCLDLFTVFDEKRSEFSSSDYVANRERAVTMLNELDFDEYLVPTQIPGLHIMKAGHFDAGYARRVSEFQWDRLFRETIGLFAGFADYLRENYDYVLLDSRTGMSDTSGICTMLLPDKLVVVFTPNQQSLTGIGDLARKAVAYRKASPDARPLTVFPLPSRLEMARPALLDAWRTGRAGTEAAALPQDLIGYQPLFEQLFDEIYSRKGTGLSEYFDAVMLQHIPDYAYGEPIAVMLEETDSRLFLRSSYAAFAERMTDLQAPWESLAQVRLEKEIQGRCEDARAEAAAGHIESALRLAYGLMERKPPNTLFETVARTILDVARAAYPHAREQVSAMLSQAANRAAMQDLDPAQVADIVVEAGTLCLEAGEYRLARSLLQQGMKRLRERLGEDAPAVLSAGNKFVEATTRLGALAEARGLAETAMISLSRVLGEEHPDTLTSMSNLAETLRAQGDLAGARALQEKVLEVRRRVLGEQHPDTLGSMNNLAGTLWQQGDYPGARALGEKVLEVSRRVLGEEHPATLTSMNNLASTLSVQGDLAGARALQEKVVAVSRRVLGEEHPDTRAALVHLFTTMQEMGDTKAVAAMMPQLLKSLGKGEGGKTNGLPSHER